MVANLKEGCLEPSSDEKLLFQERILEASKFTIGHHYRQFTVNWSADLSSRAGPGCTGASAPLTSVTWLHHGNTVWACTLWQNGESDTPICKMRYTHPHLNHCPDNTKLACHRRVRSKMEWIYTWTKVSGQGSLESALEKQKERKKERKIDKWLFFYTASSGVSMDVWGLW